MNVAQLINIGEGHNILAEFYEGEYKRGEHLQFTCRDDCKPYLTRKVTYIQLGVDREFLNDGRSTLIVVFSKTEEEGTDTILTHPSVNELIEVLDPDIDFKIINHMTKNALVLAIAIDDESLGEERPLLLIAPSETIIAVVNPFQST